MMTLAQLINEYRNYYIHRRRMMIDDLAENEFKAFLLGLEIGALNSNDMKYYSKVVEIIDSYKEGMEK